ncbi:hypothetical protein ScFU29_16320 [Streptococcus canis]|nr:hypothetical protein ScFU29_16320 [Streptococcus canis]
MDLFRIAISKGDQFDSDFVAINPNSKIPALLDLTAEESIRVFESVNSLLYLADKYGKLIPQTLKEHARFLTGCFDKQGLLPY